ncbi:SIR2 family protein [Rhodococcus qingshengii]|uniref:SIR2 family protein n=1 Tax=Rhodococcus qingshengii TaxID=334542 RepID=UPI0028F1FCFE|nr:SIR2 family protein [Rhodococcus qingshengii]MDT9664637.1 SIR2 family protein [Rhodococcus qingshengii]
MSANVVRLGSDKLVAVDGDKIDDVLDLPARRKLESWLAAILQSEHLALLTGNGLSLGVGDVAGALPPVMNQPLNAGAETPAIQMHAKKTADDLGRAANIEDEIRSALALAEGYDVLGDVGKRDAVLAAVDSVLKSLISGVLEFERGLRDGISSREPKALAAQQLLQRFLLPFASRAVGRDRLNLFTTNYDRLLEFAGDLLGLRLLDRFVGSIEPVFNASRLDIDMHYSPPGIRGEPRYLEGVVRIGKLHGSLEWRTRTKKIVKTALPFGAEENHPAVPEKPTESVIIYPNPAKDVETLSYPYAEMFRDFAASICRPNAVLVTYGYGFGDGHINRVIADMLTIPSTHLVVISYGELKGLETFKMNHYPPSQTTELIGAGIASLDNLVEVLPSLPSLTLLDRQIQHADAVGRLRSATGDTGPAIGALS